MDHHLRRRTVADRVRCLLGRHVICDCWICGPEHRAVCLVEKPRRVVFTAPDGTKTLNTIHRLHPK